MIRKPKLEDYENVRSSELNRWKDEPCVSLWAHRVDLQTSTLRSGGKRIFMICPHCRQRCTRLFYLETKVVCRLCSGLKYASQSKSWEQRNLLRIKSLAEQLGTMPFAGASLERRRYMRRRRFTELVARLRVAEKERIDYLWPPHAPDNEGLKRFMEAISKPARVELHSEVTIEYRTSRRSSGRPNVGHVG